MAPGDNTRAWFPEMLEELKTLWVEPVDWDTCAKLCRYMTEVRTRLKRRMGILPAFSSCDCCGGKSQIGPAPISIRSMLFALQKSGVVTEDHRIELEQLWLRHKKKFRLDGYGDPQA
jgi:hypothetical protein